MKRFKSFFADQRSSLEETVCRTCKGTGIHPEGGENFFPIIGNMMGPFNTKGARESKYIEDRRFTHPSMPVTAGSGVVSIPGGRGQNIPDWMDQRKGSPGTQSGELSLTKQSQRNDPFSRTSKGTNIKSKSDDEPDEWKPSPNFSPGQSSGPQGSPGTQSGPQPESGKDKDEDDSPRDGPPTRAQSFKALIKQHPEILAKLFAESGKKSVKPAYAPPTGGSGYSNPPAESGKKRKEGGTSWPDLNPGGSMRDYASKVTPRVVGGFAGTAGAGRLTAALRWGNKIIAGKPGDPHSELAPYADKLGKPDAMGFVNKKTGSTDVGEHGGAFFSRQQATRIGNKHPELKNDPIPEKPEYPSQSYDFKPEGGKKRKESGETPDTASPMRKVARAIVPGLGSYDAAQRGAYDKMGGSTGGLMGQAAGNLLSLKDQMYQERLPRQTERQKAGITTPGPYHPQLPESGKKKQPSHEHAGLLFYGPQER